MIDPAGIMMIEPPRPASEVPVIDSLTRRMTAAWRSRQDGEDAYRGFHVCGCGARSDNREHYVPSSRRGLRTNSLCVHYLAYHRADVPPSELAKIELLTRNESDPTPEELAAPGRRGGW